MKYFFPFITFLCLALSNVNVVTINDVAYTESMFYEFYPKSEWIRLKNKQKNNVLNDFIRRTTAVLETKELNLHYNPSLAIKMRNRSERFLVNRAYEQFVAMPLIDPEYLALGKKNIKRELLVYHILISYNGCELPNASKRSPEEAYQLASSILVEISDSSSFSNMALKHSEDPSVTQNNGKLGWIYWGKVDPDFQKEVFLLDSGDISDPILTKFGYHIVYVEEEKPSEASIYPIDKLEERLNYSSMGSVRHLLKEAAENYDKRTLFEQGFFLNEKMMDRLSLEVVSKKSNSSYMNNIDFVPVFQELQLDDICVVFGGKGYGLSWFINRMKRSAPSQRPQMIDKESLRLAFKTIVLQYLAEEKAKEALLYNSFGYISHFNSIEKEVYYDSFVRFLVNNAPEPKESEMVQYYEKNKLEKYMDLEKFSVRNLKVKNIADINLFYEQLLEGSSFESLAKRHSILNPENGGKMRPFDKTSYKNIYSAIKNISIGNYSKPFKTRDNHWSIVLLDEVFPEKVLPYDRVKARIKTALKKDNQNQYKEETFKRLESKYNVNINSKFFDENSP